jgi:hypothetical protein
MTVTLPAVRPPTNDTEERLLDAALTLFAEKGYEAASVREIIEATGVTRQQANQPWPLPNAGERKRYHGEQAKRAEQHQPWFVVSPHLGRLLAGAAAAGRPGQRGAKTPPCRSPASLDAEPRAEEVTGRSASAGWRA